MELVYEKDDTFSILLIVVYLGLSNSQCVLTRSVWKKFDIQNVRLLAGWLWICSGLQYLQCQHPDVTSCRVYRDVSNRIHGIPAGIQEFIPPEPEVVHCNSPFCKMNWSFKLNLRKSPPMQVPLEFRWGDHVSFVAEEKGATLSCFARSSASQGEDN